MALRRVTRSVPKTLRLSALASVRFYASSSYDSNSSYASSSSGDSYSSSSSPSSSGSSSSNQNSDGLAGSDNAGTYKKREDLTPLTIHVKGLPPTATKEKFTQALESAGFSGISRVSLPANVWTQGSRGFAFVTFDSPESLAKARTLPISYEGTPLTISGARTKEESAKYKVYIGDLNYNTNDADLKTALEQFGPIEYAAVTSDGGASRGYAFATFKTVEAADAARAAGKFTLDDSVVRIEKVRQNEDSRRGDRFGDRRGDRYGSDRRGGYGGERSYGESDSYDRGSRGGDRYSDRGSRGGDRFGGDRSERSSGDRYGDRSERSSGDRYGGDRSERSSGDRYGDRSSRGGDRYGSSRGGDRYGSSDRSGSSSSGSDSGSLY